VKSTISTLLCGLVLSMAANTSLAAGTPEGQYIQTITSGIPHSALFGISFDAGTGVAVGIGGSVLTTGDGGATWTPVKQDATELALLAVERRGSHTIAVGQLGVAIIETAPGQWKKADTGVEGRLLSVSVNSSGLAVAGGEFGLVIKSTDGGQTWAQAAPVWTDYADPDQPGTAEPHIYSVHVSERGDITVAGEFGVILRQDAGSDQWRVLNPLKAGTPTLFAMHLSDSPLGNSYAVGQAGEVLISTNGGDSWFRNRAKTQSNFLGVTSAPGGKVVITGMRVMMRSGNGGIDWSPIEEGDTTTDWYQAVRTERGSGRIMAVGYAGRIIQIKG